MIELFSVGISINLIDRVSGAMGSVIRSLTTGEAAAGALQARLSAVQSTFGNGLIMMGGGAALAAPLLMAAKASEGYVHQLNMMNSAGLSHKEIADSVAASWQTAGKVMTSTATENLKIIMDLRSVFGKTGEGLAYMPKFAAIQGAYSGVLDGKLAARASEQSFALAKSLDMIGKVKNKDEFNRSAEAMFKVTEATGGRVLPSDYQATFKYMRQSKYGFQDDFLYKVLPELMLENKGGGSGSSGGVGPQLAALYRFGVQGIMNKRSAESLREMGMVPQSSILQTTTSGTTLKGGILGSGMLSQNPFEWVQKILLPRVEAQYKIKATDTDALITRTNQIFKGNQLAASLVAEFVKKPQQYSRFPGLYEKTDSIDQALSRGEANSPETAKKMLAAQFENLGTAIGKDLTPVLILAANRVAAFTSQVTNFVNQHPRIVQAGAAIMAAGSAILFAGGAALIAKAGFGGIGIILQGIKAIPAGLGGLAKALPGFEKLGAGLVKLVPLLGAPLPVLAALAIGVGALIIIMKNWDKIVQFARDHVGLAKVAMASFLDVMDKVGPVISRVIGQIGGAIGALAKGAAGIGGDFLKTLKVPDLASKIGEKVDKALTPSAAAIAKADNTLERHHMLKEFNDFGRNPSKPVQGATNNNTPIVQNNTATIHVSGAGNPAQVAHQVKKALTEFHDNAIHQAKTITSGQGGMTTKYRGREIN